MISVRKRGCTLILVTVLIVILSACSGNSNSFDDYSTADVGSYIKFGTYEQDDNTSNGSESIEWLVLAKEDGKLLVISRYILDWQYFDAEADKVVTWENSYLREWLNINFLNESFSDTEKNMIVTTEVIPDENPFDDADQGGSTSNRVFILSASELNKYFASDSDRRAEKTKIVGSTTKSRSSDWMSDTNYWWSRTMVSADLLFNTSRAAVITDDGTIDNGLWGSGYGCTSYFGVRPALWINLDEDNSYSDEPTEPVSSDEPVEPEESIPFQESEEVILETYPIVKVDSKWQSTFSDGRAWVGFETAKGYCTGVIDTDGKLIYCPNYISMYGNGLFWVSPFQDGVAFYRETQNEDSPCGIIDRDGNVLFETQIGPNGGYLILAYGNGHFLVVQHIQNFSTDEWRYGTIDRNGNVLNEMKTCDEHFRPGKWIDNGTFCVAIRYIGENFFVVPTGLYNASTAQFSPFPYYISGCMDKKVGDFCEDYTAIVIKDGNRRFAYTIDTTYEEQWKNGYDELDNVVAKKTNLWSDSSYSEGLIFGYNDYPKRSDDGYYDKDWNLVISLEQYGGNQIYGGPFSGGYAPIRMTGADKGCYVSIIDRQGNLLYEPIRVDTAFGTNDYVDNAMNGFVQVLIDGEIKIIKPDGTITTPGVDNLSILADLNFGGVGDGLICIDNSLRVRFVSLDGSKTIDCIKITNNTVSASVVS